jgi:hypothetical protein
MEDYTIFNSEVLPIKHLNVNCIVSNSLYETADDEPFIVFKTREQLANRIAHQILEDKKFFRYEQFKPDGLVEISASCVILTMEEWKEAMYKQFKRGLHYGTYQPSIPSFIRD